MRLLRWNLILVAGDCHLATSLSRSLEVAKQSSSVLQGESPPSSQSGVSSTSKRLAATPDDVLRCSCRRCDSAESLARNLKDARLSSTRPSVSSSAKPKATQMGPTRPITTRMGPTRPETTQGSPPRPGPSKRRSGDSPQRFSDYSSRQGSRTFRLFISPGESYLSPQDSPRE